MGILENRSLFLNFNQSGIKLHENSIQQNHVVANTQTYVPLSATQELMWLKFTSSPTNISYNKSVAFKISGWLDPQNLEASLNYLAARHYALRTTFTTLKGQVVQNVSSQINYALFLEDYSSLPYKAAEIKLENFILTQARCPIDLENGPLVKPFLIRLTDQEHVFLILTHQIIFDDASSAILLHQLAAVYEGLQMQQSISLPYLPTQFLDSISPQEGNLTDTTLKQDINYWAKQLSGELPVLELPTDQLRPATSSYQSTAKHFLIEKETVDSLKNLAYATNTSLYSVLLTAYYILLFRYTSQEDIIIGTTIPDREHAETQNLLGTFSRMLVLRQQLHGNQTFIELLPIVETTLSEAYQNRHSNFTSIFRELEHLQARHPMNQILFQMGQTHLIHISKGDLVFESFSINKNISDFDLLFNVCIHEDTLGCSFEYDTDLFEPDTISRFTGNFQIMLESIACNPSAKISELSMLTSAERKQLLLDWNQTANSYPKHACMHELFEWQVKRTPEAIAVISEGRQLTYAELNAQANQLAHFLRKKGVKPDILVALCMERTIDLIVSLFGILKAGGGYLPLNPAMPLDYLSFNVEDANATLLLTHTELANKLPFKGVQTICLDTDWESVAKEDTSNPENVTKPENLAYVIYTSGSTGKPKGVMIEHQSLVNFSTAAIKTYEITEQDNILQFASISFDAAVEEIFPFLAKGSTLVLRTELMLSSIDTFLKCCDEWKITVLDLPTAFFYLIASESGKTGFKLPASLRLVLIGGERVLPEQVKLWQNKVGSFPKLINTYGPTESTVVVTTFDLSSYTIDATERIPIGYPIDNVQAYILDKHLQPVPIGVPGELHIGGVALARGYLNRSALTAEKFINSPFIAGEKLYKTGDLVCYQPDGSIIYLGRIDSQVKIRGFRIELGEIETILNQHESIQDVVVIAREDIPGDKRVVAYIVTASGKDEDENTLKNFLKSRVPHYMVPSAIVQLPAFPLTVNGKVNKKALPAPPQCTSAGDEYIAPVTGSEQILADIWAKLFNLQKVSTRDNFFESGGHSLMAVKLFSEIRSKTGKELPISILYTNPDIEKLAKFIEDTNNTTAWQSLVPIRTVTGKVPIYFIHHGGGALEYAQRITLFLDKDQPVYGLQPKGLNGIDKPLETIEDMADYYIKFILANQSEGPFHLGGYSTGGLIAYEIAKKLAKQGKTIGELFIFDTYPNHYKFTFHDIGYRFIIKSSFNLLTSSIYLKDFYHKKRWLDIQRKPVKSIEFRLQKMSSKLGIGLLTNDENNVPSLNDNVRKRFLALNNKAEKNYRLAPYPGKLVFIRALENAAEYLRGHDFGWKKFAQGGVLVHDVSGDHDTLFDETDNAKKIANIVQSYLNNSNQPIN